VVRSRSGSHGGARFRTAIQWQNQVPYGLTAGLHSLDEGECQYWIDHVEAGNLYLNRGVTGAVVSRQPFGGWKRSSVGPTAKAGGRNYVNCLRNWPKLHDKPAALEELASWWDEFGSRARDEAGLDVEVNVQRYRRALAPIVVRIDETTGLHDVEVMEAIANLTGATIPSVPRVVLAACLTSSSRRPMISWRDRHRSPRSAG